MGRIVDPGHVPQYLPNCRASGGFQGVLLRSDAGARGGRLDTVMTRAPRNAGRSGPGPTLTLASEGDRARAFRSARRHSALVRALKIVLPLGAGLAVVAYVGALVVTSGIGKHCIGNDCITAGPVRIDPTRLVMETPVYDGFGSDGTRYQVRAREAITDLKMTGPIRLNAIEGDLVQPTGVVTKLKAAWGTYDQKKDVLELYERIDIDGSTGMQARLTRATVFTKDNRIISPEPIVASMPTGEIRARTMELLTKDRLATFKDDVEVRLKPTPKPPAAAGAPAKPGAGARKGPPGALPGLAVSSDQPIDVRAEQLDVDDNAHTALFRRSVVAKQGEAMLQAAELDVHYEGRDPNAKPAAGVPKPPVAVGGPDPTQARLKRLLARGNVVMTNKADRATSDAVDYDAAAERAVLTGSVVMTSGADRRVTTRRAELDQKADTALLTGDVVVVQGKNTMKGQRLFIDRRAGRTRLETPGEAGQPPGRISTVFFPSEQKAATAKERQKTAGAAPAASPFGVAFKTNPDAPIEIEAETLDVTDATHTALYRVNVIAKQGEFVVRTAEMTAYYTGQTQLMTAQAPGAKKVPGQPAMQLTRVEARQKVVVTSRDGQTATGDWANFDVKTNIVVIGGNVVVAQGRNVITGTRFVIDMTTGLSRMEQGAQGPPGAPGTPQAQQPGGAPKGPALSSAYTGTGPTCPPGVVCKTGRASAVIYPHEMQEKAKQKAAEVPGTKLGTDARTKVRRAKPSAAPPASAWGDPTIKPAQTP